MAEEIRKSTETTTDLGDTVRTTREVRSTTDQDGEDGARASGFAVALVRLLAGILLSLLAIRFFLSLLGANRENAFASLVYNVTHPFVAPFFGLFSYEAEYGVSRLELGTLVAMVVYGLIALAIIKLILLPRRTA